MKFFKTLFAYLLGTFLGVMISIIFIFILVVKISTNPFDKRPDSPIKLKPDSILELNLNCNLKEYKDDISLDNLLNRNNTIFLDDIKKSIIVAKNDPNIIGINLVFGNDFSTSTSYLYNIIGYLENFKMSGKFINSFSDFYTQPQYLLASCISDSIFINPRGEINFYGFSISTNYYKDFQDKYGIKADIIRHGKYKSAVEPFLRNDMSKENKEQLSAVINSSWNYFLEKISKKRNISKETLNQIADQELASIPNNAKKLNLIDDLIYKNDFIAKYTNTVDFNDLKNNFKENDNFSKNKIAILYTEGEIEYNSKDNSKISEINFLKELKKISDDNSIKALVLRVNSPGGSALASDIIWHELKKLKEKMPIVVSMSDLAASGGYYISSASNYIFAEHTTITGSIGVFGMIPNLETFIKKNGIYTEVVKTNKNSETVSLIKGISEDKKNIILKNIEETYSNFLDAVSENRNMKKEDVDKIGQGRVWIGTDALKKNLVDEIGNVDNAVKKASELAKIEENFKTVSYPKKTDKFSSLINSLMDDKSLIINLLFKNIFNTEIYIPNKTIFNNNDIIYSRIEFNTENMIN